MHEPDASPGARRPSSDGRRRALAVALAGLVGLATLAGCEPIEMPADAGGVVSADLDALTVADWAPMTGYSRARFPHWEAQGEGCDTRDRVLQRDGTAVVTADHCDITSGSWFSPYDGETFADPGELDVDHMVPLANAWRTGAAAWTDEQRGAFANDLIRPQLLAVGASVNRSKGDQDPSQWRPPRREYWCTYAQSWITVKAYWKLSITFDEKAALADMLGTCP